MDINLENYEEFDSIRELMEVYDKDNHLDHLLYADKDHLVVDAVRDMYEVAAYNERYFAWKADIHTSDSEFDHVKLLYNNLTYINMKQLTKKILSTECISYETTTERNEEEGTYNVGLVSSNNKIEIEVSEIPARCISKKTISTDLVTLTIKDSEIDNGPIIKHYLFNSGLYVVINEFDDSETYCINNETIRLKFEDKKLTHNEFLQYHNPIKATLYEADKEYIMKYDDKGMMTSMIEISDPETNLCQYNKEVIDKLSEEIVSIHPNIYDKFNLYYVNPNFFNSKEVVVDTYTKDYGLGHTIHATDVVLVD